MSGLTAKDKISEATISARIIRADGTIEDLGVIAEMKPDSFTKRLFTRLKTIFGGN
jgi:hypothetical protein